METVPYQRGSHYDDSEGDLGPAYPPPTYIDFAFGDLRPPFPPTRRSPLSFHCQWLGGPHDGYPLASTLDEYVQLRQSGPAPGSPEYAALVQSQLTFGLLEAILRIQIPESFLLAQAADGVTMLSTVNLTALLRDWYHRLSTRHHPEKCSSYLEDVYMTLSDASQRLWVYHTGWNTTASPFSAAGIRQGASEDILRVSCTIGDALENVLRVLPSECDTDRTSPSLLFLKIPDWKLTEDQLRAHGWCPLSIPTLGLYGFVVPEYTRSVRPFLRHTGEHSLCTATTCTVNNTDLTTYIQRHFPDNCVCAYTIPPLHPVESLLSNGRIPVVTLVGERLVVLAAEDTPYVAISHVWIDGMGSTTEAGLPACQVSRIAAMASSLVPGSAFWIDGLCVPEKRELRKRAIQLMAKTYTDAAAVLVIDIGIRSCSIYAPLEEKLLRVYTSGWMQRLWTYQEAMLAKRLCFEFADGLVDLEDLMPSLEEMATTPILSVLCLTLCDIRDYMSDNALPNYTLTISDIAYALRWRTTSRSADETLAIAGLLQIDVHELLNASCPDERMKSLLLQKRTVSPRIIFATAPKISDVPGFSWAPRSFMTGPHPGLWSGEESAICTPTGLLAEYPTLIFSEPVKLSEDARYVIRDAIQPDCAFLLRPISFVRDKRQQFCNAILINQDVSPVVGSHGDCVGVRMEDMEEGAFGERRQVCHYQDIQFILEVIEVSQQPAAGTLVMYAKWCPDMRVKVV